MSLIRQVIDLVDELKRVTVEDLEPLLPEYTRKQIHRAVNQASYIRAIKIVEHGKRLSGGGSLPCVYGPINAVVEDDDAPLITRTCIRGDYGIPRVSSVWQLGAMA